MDVDIHIAKGLDGTFLKFKIMCTDSGPWGYVVPSVNNYVVGQFLQNNNFQVG